MRIAVEHWRTFGVEGGPEPATRKSRGSAAKQTRRVAGPASIVVVSGARLSGTVCDQKDPFGRGGSTAIRSRQRLSSRATAQRADLIEIDGPYRTASSIPRWSAVFFAELGIGKPD